MLRTRIAVTVLRVTAERIETMETFSDDSVEFAFYEKKEKSDDYNCGWASQL